MAYFTLPPDTVGLIVRGKTSDSHSPGVMEQHADCVLASGEPIGFYGRDGDGKSGGSSASFQPQGTSASWNSSGMNMKGFVADYDELRKIRPYYVDVAQAKKYRVISTMLLVKVTAEQVKLFHKAWMNLKLSPGSFNLLGGNCSTHASIAFVEATILNRGIPGLDTPDNLYKQLKAKYPGKYKSYSGHLGFRRSAPTSSMFELVVEAPVKLP